MKKIDLALAIGFVAAIFLTSFTSFARDCEDVRQSVVRLHILANSDNADDQELKLAVRDEVLAQTSDLFSASRTKDQAEAEVAKRLGEIESIAKEVVTARGYNYEVKAELVNMFFDTRVYGDVIMPAGRYDAVRVKIGSAKGKNWWCVMFPPMCIPAASEKLEVEEQIDMLGQEPRYVPKLAVLELVEKIVHNNSDIGLSENEQG